jgi:hypothetical protein
MPGFQSGFQSGFQQSNVVTTDGLRVHIGGVDRTGYVRSVRNLDITYTLGSRGVARFEVLDMPADNTFAYRPGVDLSVVLKWYDETIFSGYTVTVADRALGDTDKGVVTAVTAVDHANVADDRLITKQYAPEGLWTLRSVIADIIAEKLSVFGIVIDPTMGSGPAVDELITFDGVTVQAAFSWLMQETGWLIRITPDKVVEAFPMGAVMAPYSLTAVNSTIRGGVTWSKNRTKYVNTVTVRYGGTQRIVRTDTWIADGVLDTFFLTELAAIEASGLPETRGLVTVNGVDQTLHGTWTFRQTVDPLGKPIHAIEANYVPAAGAVITLVYAVQVPHDVTRTNATEVLIRGPRELLDTQPQIVTKADAIARADAILQRNAIIPRQAQLKTWEGMVYPGDTVPINVPTRTLTGNWLITEVRVRDAADNILEYDLTCLEGNEAQFTWVDYFRNAFGGSVSVGGTVSGSFAPQPSGFFGHDVFANVTANNGILGTNESSLRGSRATASYSGPALVLGQESDEHTWEVVADQINPSPILSKGLYFVPTAERLTTRFAMALKQPSGAGVVGEYYLVPNVTGKLYLGADWFSAGWGSVYQIEHVYTDGGVSERGRDVAMGVPKSYTPVWGSTGGTPITVGNATRTGRYSLLGTKVVFDIHVTIGSTSAQGAGNVFTFSIPSTAAAGFGAFQAWFINNGQFYSASAYLLSTTTVAVVITGTTASGIGAGNPNAWATGNQINISGWYHEA